MIEQFIRQSMFIPSKPLVVLSNSLTPNWNEEECKKHYIDYTVNEDDKDMLSKAKSGLDGLKHILVELNSKNRAPWGKSLHEMLHSYQGAGVQVFDHHFYESYKCWGPYIKTWGDGAAPWHPSIMGHKVRAHHYSYAWLTAYRVAIQQILAALKNDGKINSMLTSVNEKLAGMHAAHNVPNILYNRVPIVDNIQCYTEFDPHQDKNRTLNSIILSGFDPKNKDINKGWISGILETLVQPSIIESARARGYLDFKNIIYGTNRSGPLNFQIEVRNEGNLFVCQAPGLWGKMPDNFANLWDSNLQLYLTPIVLPLTDFLFVPHPKNALPYSHERFDELCLRVSAKVLPGHYVLTVYPSSLQHTIMVSTILVP
jgi:hypothetical protein